MSFLQAAVISQHYIPPVNSGVSVIYAKGWGRAWPGLQRKTIYSREIVPDDDHRPPDASRADALETDATLGMVGYGSVSENDGAVDGYGGAPDLAIPERFDYDCYEGMTEVSESLQLPGRFSNKLVVRDEYKWLLNLVEKGVLKDERAIVVTGHPGIGKTTFLFYALLSRLERKLPTAIQLQADRYVIFDQQGVVICSGNDAHVRLNGCLALSDGNDHVKQPCLAFQTQVPEHVIQTTSPKVERWKSWLKHAMGTTVALDLPQVLEMAAIIKELGHDNSRTLSYMRKWGPCTRTIIQITREGEQDAGSKERAKNACMRAAEDSAKCFCRDPESLLFPLHEVTAPIVECSSLIFIRPIRCIARAMWDEFTNVIPFVPTKHLSQLLDCHRSQLSHAKSLEISQVFSSHVYTRTTEEWTFEKIVHRCIYIERRPFHIFRGQETKKMPVVDGSTYLLSGTLAGLGTADRYDSFYWIPSGADFPGVDSILGDRNSIFAIQTMAASSYQSPVKGLLRIWNCLSPIDRKKRVWYMVVVSNDTKTNVEDVVRDLSLDLAEAKLDVPVSVWGCMVRARG